MDNKLAVTIVIDRNAELTQHAKRSQAVLASQVIPQPARTIAQRGKHGGAVRHAFVAGNRDVRGDLRRAMDSDFHGQVTGKISAR